MIFKVPRLLFAARIELENNTGTYHSSENQNNNGGAGSIMAGPLKNIPHPKWVKFTFFPVASAFFLRGSGVTEWFWALVL